MLPLALLCSLATPATAGVSVGHPTLVTIAQGDGVVLTEADVFINDLILEDCQGNPSTSSVDAGFDLLGQQTLGLPSGGWCGASMAFGTTFHLEGASEGGGTWEVDLDVSTVPFDVPEAFDVVSSGASYSLRFELAFPGWIWDSLLNVPAGQHTVIPTASPLAQQMAASLALDSAVVFE
jgi:hypothetical protein